MTLPQRQIRGHRHAQTCAELPQAESRFRASAAARDLAVLLEQLFGKLRRRRLVRASRPGGGQPAPGHRVGRRHHLRRRGPIDSTQCSGRENCRDNERCMTHRPVGRAEQDRLRLPLDGETRELVDKQRTRPVAINRRQAGTRLGLTRNGPSTSTTRPRPSTRAWRAGDDPCGSPSEFRNPPRAAMPSAGKRSKRWRMRAWRWRSW